MDIKNSECSAKLVPKTHACTNCYSRICDTCQIREDFLFQERSTKSHRSELFIDEIYTCNKCDQTWMNLFTYCITCSRLVCRSFKDEHDDCEKHYGLMESDIRKRRKLVEFEKEMKQFALNLEKSRNDLEEVYKRERCSNFVSVLKSSVSAIISKIEDTVNSHVRDSELFKTQLLSVEQYLVQQNYFFNHFKERMQNIRRKLTFPVAFLQELSEWEKSFLKLRNNHSRFDLSTLNSNPVIIGHCRPKQLDQYFIAHILGIQENPSREGNCHFNESHETLICSGSSARIPVSNQAGSHKRCSQNPSREGKCHSNESHETLRCSGSSARIPVSNQAGGLTGCSQVETVQKSKTLPHLNKKYDYYQLHLLETQIKLKDECIQKLKSKQETLKNHIQLLQNSRNAADCKMKRLTNLFETQLQERDELHKEELQTVTNHKNQLEEDFLEVKTKMEQQLNIQEKEYEDLKARQGNHIHDLESENEFLKLEVKKTEDAFQKAANDVNNENQKAEERIKQYIELAEFQKHQIEGLQDHVDFLNRGSHKTTKETEEENQRLNAKLEKVRHIFIEWRKSSSGLNNIMAHELDLDDILIESESKQQQCRQQTDKQNFDSMSSNSISASITSREHISGKEESTTASESNTAKHITSVSYTAEHIHIIQNSQVSLADSGYDAKSFTGELD